MKSAAFVFGGFLSLCVVVGCSSGKEVEEFDVTGSVTINGEPIPQGTITFVAADGSTPTGGGIIIDGRYTAKVPPGEKKVMVLGNKLVGKEPLYEGVPDSPTRDKFEMITPPAYNAEHLTPLAATIDGPKEDLNFELTKNVKGT